jgi:hypothetical protein
MSRKLIIEKLLDNCKAFEADAQKIRQKNRTKNEKKTKEKHQ